MVPPPASSNEAPRQRWFGRSQSQSSFKVTEEVKEACLPPRKGTSMDDFSVTVGVDLPQAADPQLDRPASGSSATGPILKPKPSRRSRPSASSASAAPESPPSSMAMELNDDDKAEIEAMSLKLALAANQGVSDDQGAVDASSSSAASCAVEAAAARVVAAQACVEAAEAALAATTHIDDDEMAAALRQLEQCQSDPGCPPPRYVEGMHGDLPEAQRRWAGTLAWQKEYGLRGLLTETNPQYGPIRQHFSHCFHGHGRSGSVVLYLRPGYSDFQQLWKTPCPGASAAPGAAPGRTPDPAADAGAAAVISLLGDALASPAAAAAAPSLPSSKASGENSKKTTKEPKERLVEPDDLVRHHVFMLEALFSHWGPAIECKVGEQSTAFKMQRLVAVFDLDRLNFSNLRQFFGVFKKVVKILEQHYVGRADRICIINAPNFRNIAMLVYPLIPREVKAKIKVCGRNYQDQLSEILVPEEMPQEYGGGSKVPLGEWHLEQQIQAQCAHPQRRWPPLSSLEALYSPTDAHRFSGVSPEGVMPEDEPDRLQKHGAEAFRRGLERRRAQQAALADAQAELAAAVEEEAAACDSAASAQVALKGEGDNTRNAPPLPVPINFSVIMSV